MKLKNIYKMWMILSLFFGIVPLLSYIVALVLAKFWDCWKVLEVSVSNCSMWDVISSLVVITWFTVITLPLWLLVAFIFYFLYISVRRR